jgi:hypothetical protein
MRFSKSTWKIALIVLIGFCGIYLTISESNDPLPFNLGQKIFIGFSIIFIILFIWSLYKDTKKFLSTRKYRSYVQTFICTLLTLVYILTSYLIWQQDKSPRILSAEITASFYDSRRKLGFGYYIDFRADKTYKLKITSLFSENYHRGSYKMTNSIIELDRSIIDTIIVSNRLIIKKNVNNSRVTEIYQVDNKGNQIENSEIFSVLEEKQ